MRHLFLEVERAPVAKDGTKVERGLAQLAAAEERPSLKAAALAPASRGAPEIPKNSYPPPKPGKGKKKRR